MLARRQCPAEPWRSLAVAAALLGLFPTVLAPRAAEAPLPVLQRSDVVFMYQAGRSTYQDYGATVLAWGGRPTEKCLAEAEGVKFFGSVGMVTEFSRYHDRFPQTYEQGLCRDVEGQPYKVPWLTDHQHRGIPFWWCCTRQPVFRQYLSERVRDTVQAGAHGVHIDDHLGTAGGLWLGGCFCDRCVAEFPAYLERLPAELRSRLGLGEPAGFDYRAVVRAWLAEQPGRRVASHPLWPHWRIYQLRGAAQFMAELRALASRTAGRSVPVGANAGLLWPAHLADYRSLDLFSAEISHQAERRRWSDAPLVAYRLADAVGRPLAATASGGDWAYIKEHNLPGMVQGWIALSYAAGQALMAPHRQWCHTSEKGTHWYDGPKEKFAPLYRFVRQHPFLFDDYVAHADLTVALSHRTFDRQTSHAIALCNQLAAANLAYRLALGSDDIVDHPLPAQDLERAPHLLVLAPTDFSAEDQRLLAGASTVSRYATVDEALARVTPAVRLEPASGERAEGAGGQPSPSAPVRVLPRVKTGGAVVHLVNGQYDAGRDGAVPVEAGRWQLQLELETLGVAEVREARWFRFGAEPVTVPVEGSKVRVPAFGLWALLELRR